MAGLLADEPFSIIDVGCNGGVNRKWRDSLGADLRGWGIDPVVAEIERLQREETGGLQYWCGYIGLPADHPLMVARAGASMTTASRMWIVS